MKSGEEIIDSGYYYIKPAANHILTIGKGIIKDSYTAILELVKNSYDADAEKVTIKLTFQDKKAKIIIEDDGHGMNFETVTQKWMVPSIQDKIRQKKSKYKKRPLQGRKGIGRYAASILGEDLLMQTTDKETLSTTELLIDWNEFTTEKFLEEVSILIESYKSKISKSGTLLSINSQKIWSDREIDELISTLKRLLSPFDEIDNDFKIFIEVTKEESEKYSNFSEQIRPLPILEYYHYRISGTIDLLEVDEQKNEILIAKLTIENRNKLNILPIQIERKILLEKGEKFCGLVNIDIRAFDLDEQLTQADENISSDEAKKQLKELPGIAVIREGFRVRPYGDKKFDWLGLNERRYNNPTLRLSSNQVAGYVTILQEDESHLEEKATREGFKEDEYYEALRTCVISCLSELEPIRYRFRKQYNKGGRKPKTINEQIDQVSNFENLANKVDDILSKINISDKDTISSKLKDAIKEEVKEKELQLNEIKKTIAIYQGQVTLGKIMTVVFHEGRKPLNAIRQHPKFIETWSKEFVEILEQDSLSQNQNLKILYEKILDRLNDNKRQAEIFINIFKKLEPLANNKRSVPSEFIVSKPIHDSFKLFESELFEKNISYNITGDLNAMFKGWATDIEMTFANLIENSIYWLTDRIVKTIDIKIEDTESQVIIDYQDSGTGIDEEDIQSQDIFDPGFSTKEKGTGLGLSIAGEAIERNRGKIRAISSNIGANFIIELNK